MIAAARRLATGAVALPVAAALSVAAAAGPVAPARGASAPAHAAAATSTASTTSTVTVARWMLDERYGATVARDVSGNGHDGTIGSMVRPGVPGYYETAFRFTPPSAQVNDPQRLVRVPDAAGLDPGWRTWHVSLRVRTGASGHFNILQKGQATTAGGFWKVQMDYGYPICVFLGVNTSGTRVTAGIDWPNKVNDGAWHRIVCDKYPSYIRMSVDGATPILNHKTVGHIDNTWAVVMGGKISCKPGYGVDCDYYNGDLDSVILSAD